jgi:hypothetical protein
MSDARENAIAFATELGRSRIATGIPNSADQVVADAEKLCRFLEGRDLDGQPASQIVTPQVTRAKQEPRHLWITEDMITAAVDHLLNRPEINTHRATVQELRDLIGGVVTELVKNDGTGALFRK